MAILTHGSDLTLAPTIKPVVKQTDGTLRTAVDRLVKLGFRSIQLDATLPGIRPRDLNERARKDLAALFTRAGASISGLDFFIPTRHFVDTDQLDRAVSAATAAIALAADLGRVPVSIALPMGSMSEEIGRALIEAADGRGVRLAVHAEPHIDKLLAWVDRVDIPALGIALDPAASLAHGQNPVDVVSMLGKRLAVARLCDISGADIDSQRDNDSVTAAGIRCEVGEGDLDVVAYRIALDLAAGRSGPIVLDVRGMENPLNAAAKAAKVWGKAAFTV